MTPPEAPHAPKLEYLCDDYRCCENGAPSVTCRSCGRSWPCLSWQGRHTVAQIDAKRRWVARKYSPGDEDGVEWMVRNPSSYWADIASAT